MYSKHYSPHIHAQTLSERARASQLSFHSFFIKFNIGRVVTMTWNHVTFIRVHYTVEVFQNHWANARTVAIQQMIDGTN